MYNLKGQSAVRKDRRRMKSRSIGRANERKRENGKIFHVTATGTRGNMFIDSNSYYPVGCRVAVLDFLNS